METSKMDWETACATASKFLPVLEQRAPDLVEELQGMAFVRYKNNNLMSR